MEHMVWFGICYSYASSALDCETKSYVAIKRINQIDSLLVARRTLRELKLLKHFRGHPNVFHSPLFIDYTT